MSGDPITVVVPTKGKSLDYLSDLVSNHREFFDWNIILYDQTDDNRLPLKLKHVRHEIDLNCKSAIDARSRGGRLVESGYILFCDDDIYFNKEFVPLLRSMIQLSVPDVISPILFDVSHTRLFSIARGLAEILLLGSKDKRAIIRMLEVLRLPHCDLNYLWGGCYIINTATTRESKRLNDLVVCSGKPVQHGDLVLGTELRKNGIQITTSRGLRVLHRDKNLGKSKGYVDARMVAAEYSNYTPLQAFLFNLIVKLGVEYRKRRK